MFFNKIATSYTKKSQFTETKISNTNNANDIILGFFGLIILNIIAYVNIYHPSNGSVFSSVKTTEYNNNYHDGLVISDAMAVISIIIDIAIIFSIISFFKKN